MIKFNKICFVITILIILCTSGFVAAVDNEDIYITSISSENITTSDSDMLIVEESNIGLDAIDKSDLCNDLSNNRELLGIDNSKDILGNSYEFEGSTFEQLQTKINELNPGDVLYIGNKSLISTWEPWGYPNIINVNTPNIKISGGSISNPTATSTLDGNLAKIFSLNANNITLTNLILTHSSSQINPAESVIITAPNCLIENCTIKKSKGQNGGGISANSNANGTIINNCNFTENQGIWYGSGAAIKLEGPNSKITNCNFIENNAANGIVYLSGFNTLIENCTFKKNTVENAGAGIYVNTQDCIISNCSFESNHAKNGGAIFVDQSGKHLIIKNSILYNNSAYNGGALFADWNSNDMLIKNTLFNNNTAIYAGGALFIRSSNNLLDNCTFNYNNALQGGHNLDFGGGAIWAGFSIVNVTNSKFNNNTAPYGGALRGSFNLDNDTFINNTATDGNGGGIDLTCSNDLGSVEIKMALSICSSWSYFFSFFSFSLIFFCVLCCVCEKI